MQNFCTSSERNSMWTVFLPYRLLNNIKEKAKILLQMNVVAATDSLKVIYGELINAWKGGWTDHKPVFQRNQLSIITFSTSADTIIAQLLKNWIRSANVFVLVLHFKLVHLWKIWKQQMYMVQDYLGLYQIWINCEQRRQN